MFSTSGIASLGHFAEISPGDLDAVQAIGIAADLLQGLAVLAVAVWLAWPARTPAVSVHSGKLGR